MGKNYYTAAKSQKKEFYWCACDLVECSLTRSLILYEGLEPFLCAGSGLQACITSNMWNVLMNRKKSRGHSLKKKNKTRHQLQFPSQKIVQRLSVMKVSWTTVRIKWNFLNNANNKNVGLRFIRKDSWTKSQKTWAQNSISGRRAWNEMSVDLRCLDPSLRASLPKAVPSTAAALQQGQQGAAGLASAKTSVRAGTGVQESSEGAAHGVAENVSLNGTSSCRKHSWCLISIPAPCAA